MPDCNLEVASKYLMNDISPYTHAPGYGMIDSIVDTIIILTVTRMALYTQRSLLTKDTI